MSDPSAVLKEFVEQLRQNHEAWGLKGSEGWAICESIEFEETEVIPFFSTQDAAAKLCVGEWQSYSPASIPLEELLEDWLPGMHEDNAMVGLQWDKDLEGPEYEPAEVAAAFS